MYIVERVPLPQGPQGRRANPIREQMRRLAIGESFVIKLNDPNWTGTQVRNENLRRNGRYVIVREGDRLRIGRVE